MRGGSIASGSWRIRPCGAPHDHSAVRNARLLSAGTCWVAADAQRRHDEKHPPLRLPRRTYEGNQLFRPG
ncbi:hypothetical protein GCM10027048_24660 [Hymenobacter coalescens]